MTRFLAVVCHLGGHRPDWNGFHCRRCGASPAWDGGWRK